MQWVFMFFAVILILKSTSGNDLLDSSDSLVDCNSNTTVEVFHCDPDHCLLPSSVCNGIEECPGLEDESVQQCGCLANEFRCSNSCVALVKRCDRERDCLNGEDELECKSFLCPNTHFKCYNHFCVPLHAVCDFRDDCGDNSDERDCPHRTCWQMEYTCQNGKCVRPISVCDGRDDCLDGSDEADCSPDAFVECEDGTLVHRYQWCDGRPDCEDNHADEINCTVCDMNTEFTCPSGRCLRMSQVCDSQCDCLPSPNVPFCADELHCDPYYSVIAGVTLCTEGAALSCTVPEAAGSASRERCIRPQFLCDSYNDCHNLCDEIGCELPNDVVELGKSFRCRDNRTLPVTMLCDFRSDCLHGDDEVNCPEVECERGELRCNNGQCIPEHRFCDLVVDCHDKSDETNCSTVTCPQDHKKCRGGGQCIPRQLWCDFFVDCPDGSDEANCTNPECSDYQFQCDNGQCVDLSLRCYSSMVPREGCADRSHLKHCRDWECSREDQFKCRGGPCLHIDFLCDVNIDCKHSWDDEDGCPFTCSNTSPQCECRDIHINCTERQLTIVPADIEKEITWFHLGSNRLNETLNNETFLQYERILYLDLSNNSIRHLVPLMFRNQWRLSVLDLTDNQLSVLSNGSFYGLASLKALHLQGNQLRIIQAYTFYGLYSLIALALQGQRIEIIEPEAFVGLHSLASMDLSRNQITRLMQGTLRGMTSLQFLNISGNQITDIEHHVFHSTVTLDTLVTDEFRFCCLARQTKLCFPPPDEFSSCEDLMSNIVLRLCVWLLAGVATIGNILVIVWRTRYSCCNQVHSFLITNLALGDFIMGLYLLLIALVDSYFRGKYIFYDADWRSSKLCALAGFLSTFSSELSVFTLTVITLDRFLSINFPFKVRRLDMTHTRRLMALVWLLAGFLSALPLSYIPYFHNFYGRSGVCLALHITPDKPSGWEYSVFVFLFLNLASFSVIAVGYIWMFITARTTHLAVAKDRRNTESSMAWRMSLLVVTDAACWVPIIALGLGSLAGITVPPQVFAWVAVFVLPLNAAINPVLYTLSTAPFLSQERRRFLNFRRSCRLSRHNYSSTIPTRPYDCPRSDNNTCYSLIKRTSVRVTDEFRFCCLARQTKLCFPPPDEFSSCEDLMSNIVLRLCVWLLAGVATIGNILVIVWRTRYSCCNQVHSFLITNLALGDFIMGLYLLLIALVDSYFRGKYIFYDADWRSSKLCALAGFLSTFSSELSVFTLTVITLDRFLSINFPFKVRRLDMTHTRRLMALVWLLAGFLSALPLSYIPYFHNFYGRSGVCLALHITPDKPSGWEYSVFVFLFLNLASFSVIAVGYIWMFITARTTHLAVAKDRRNTESSMAWRMSLLVVTDAACWVPIIALGLGSLAGITVPPQVFAWVAVFVLPLNAAINPVLYTLSTAPFLSQERRRFLNFRRSCRLSRHNYSSTIPTRPYDCPRSDNNTCYSLIKRTSVRWHQKVETAVIEHGEVVTLNQLDE